MEGNINFYTELYNSLDEENEKSDKEDNLCLITNTPLKEHAVKLECGHHFNYVPLFHDIKTHKYKFNSLEGTSSRLAMNELRCPYCRKKQRTLLPYLAELGLPKINGVNHFDPSIKTSSFHAQSKCAYPILSPNDGNTHTPCGHAYATKLHPTYFTTLGLAIDENMYCKTHKALLMKQLKDAAKAKAAEEKQKLKEEKQQAKQQAKLALKEEKEALAAQKKAAKLLAKQEAAAKKAEEKAAAKGAKKASKESD
jgi:hypothetical protein